MKTKRLLRKLVSAGFLISLIIIVVMSCKKKDDEPTPTPPVPPTPVPAQSDVFPNKPIKMMSDYEIANNHDFPGHIIHSLGKGLVGGEDPAIPNSFKELGNTLWEVYDFRHTEMEFNKVMNGLKQIQGQLTQLQNQMNELSTQLSLDISELSNLLLEGDMFKYITNVKDRMDSTKSDGFGYFPREARKYKVGTITEAQMIADSSLLIDFLQKLYPDPASDDYDVCNDPPRKSGCNQGKRSFGHSDQHYGS